VIARVVAVIALVMAPSVSIHGAGESTAQVNPAVEAPRFEVASITPHRDTGSAEAGFADNPSLVRIRNLSLRALIRIAYGVMDSQLVGPSWLDSVSYDVVAKPPSGHESQQLPLLLRSLLADRFKLAVHREPREVASFALRVEPKGHRLIAAKGERTFLTGRRGLIAGNGRSIADLVPLLAQMLAAPVSDETALPPGGRYDVKLEWTPQLSPAGGSPGGDTEVSIFTAIREQLGLRLDPARMTVDAVVVDAAERAPTEN